MKEIKISICIPVFNRAKFLDNLLESIRDNLKEVNDEKVEIVISDNASTDNIKYVINKYKNTFKNLKYIRNQKNMGFDYNLNNTILNSSGEYVWFIGSDDLVFKGAIKKLLLEIDDSLNDMYILNGKVYNGSTFVNRDGLKVCNDKEYKDLDKNFSVYIDDIKEDISYLFAFITSIVVRREKYLSIAIPNYLKNTLYDHMYICLRIALNGASLKYLSNCFYVAGQEKNDWNFINGKHFSIDLLTTTKYLKDIFREEVKNNEVKLAIGHLFYRNSNNIRKIIYNINYAKDNNLMSEIKESLKFYQIYDFNYRLKICFFGNKVAYFCFPILRKLKYILKK